MVARYHINLNAFLPTGPFAADGQREFQLHEAPQDIDYDQEPSLTWVPLNDEALAAQRSLLDKVIANLEATIQTVDPKSRSMGQHLMKMNQLKRMSKDLRVAGAPAAPEAAPSAQTMSQHQASVPAAPGVQLKGSRPSDNPNRR